MVLNRRMWEHLMERAWVQNFQNSRTYKSP